MNRNFGLAFLLIIIVGPLAYSQATKPDPVKPDFNGPRPIEAVDTVFIDSMSYSKPEFFGAFFRFPIKLAPKTAYQATYVRFKPTVPGPVTGDLKVYSHYRGCTIVKRIAH